MLVHAGRDGDGAAGVDGGVRRDAGVRDALHVQDEHGAADAHEAAGCRACDPEDGEDVVGEHVHVTAGHDHGGRDAWLDSIVAVVPPSGLP